MKFLALRVGIVAALFACAIFLLSQPPRKNHFQRDDLADGAIRLEAKIKADPGTVGEAGRRARARCRRRVPAQRWPHWPAGPRPDCGGCARTTPSNWLRLSRAVRNIYALNESERYALLERAATAAYIAYQRANNRDDEADALILISRAFADRKLLAAGARQRCGCRSNCAKSPTSARPTSGCARTTASVCWIISVDADSAVAARVLPVLRGAARPAHRSLAVRERRRSWTSRRSRPTNSSLCVEGLKHGERYASDGAAPACRRR